MADRLPGDPPLRQIRNGAPMGRKILNGNYMMLNSKLAVMSQRKDLRVAAVSWNRWINPLAKKRQQDAGSHQPR